VVVTRLGRRLRALQPRFVVLARALARLFAISRLFLWRLQEGRVFDEWQESWREQALVVEQQLRHVFDVLAGRVVPMLLMMWRMMILQMP